MLPPVPAAPAPAVPAAPLASPLFVATLPMFVIVLPDTVPVTFAVALASEWLKLFEKVDVAVPPLLAATLPLAEAIASPELWLLLSVFVVVVVVVLWSLLSCVLLFVFVVVFVVVVTLWSLLSCVLLSCVLLSWVLWSLLSCVLLLVLVVVAVLVFVLLLLLSWVLLSVVRVVVCVAVLPLSAVFVSWACALSENASEIAVTSKVLFIRIPLWV
jgi:hypothetical protein